MSIQYISRNYIERNLSSAFSQIDGVKMKQKPLTTKGLITCFKLSYFLASKATSYNCSLTNLHAL